MIRIPPTQTEPEIFLYQNLTEMREALGYPLTHGLFDPDKLQIHATPDSLPHELGHYKDFSSGKMAQPHLLENSDEANRARIRNEIVALLYEWRIRFDFHSLVMYERDFFELFSLHCKKRPHQLNFQEIQELADQMSSTAFPHIAKLHKIFEHYLKDEAGLRVRISNHSMQRKA